MRSIGFYCVFPPSSTFESISFVRNRCDTRMDTLFTQSPGQFQQVAVHVSIHRDELTGGWEKFAKDTFRAALRVNADRFKYWDVEGLGGVLGKALPVDVHGQDVFMDVKALKVNPQVTHGVLKYALLASGQRRKDGGRRFYDYASMNFALGIGGVAGFTSMWKVHNRLASRPLVHLGVGLTVGLLSLTLVRFAFNFFAVGITFAQRQHVKAINNLACADCCDDVLRWTESSIEEVRNAKLPESPPGMPPPPPDVERKFRAGCDTQVRVLQDDVLHLRSRLRDWTGGLMSASSATILANTQATPQPDNGSLTVPSSIKLCPTHAGLREQPVTFVPADGRWLSQQDRQLAEQRRALTATLAGASAPPN